MTDRSTGPRCGNNPNIQLTNGDRKVVDAFRAQLALREAAKPYIERAVWEDGDPVMEVIASTLWEHCARDDEEMPQLVRDDPRTIAAFAAAVARAHAAGVAAVADQSALRDRIAEALYAHDHPGHFVPLNETGTESTYQETAAAVLAVLPASADRATVLREEAALIRAHCPDHLDSNSADGSWMNCHCDVADDMERRAPVPAPADTGHDDTIWLERRPCGCIVSAAVAHVPGEWTLATAEDVALHFHPTEGERRRAAEAGLTVEPVTGAQYREQFRDRWHCNRHAAAQQPICKCPAEICQCGHHKAQQPKEA